MQELILAMTVMNIGEAYFAPYVDMAFGRPLTSLKLLLHAGLLLTLASFWRPQTAKRLGVGWIALDFSQNAPWRLINPSLLFRQLVEM